MNKISKLFKTIAFTIFILTIIALSLSLEMELKTISDRTYNIYPYIIFLSFYPILIGIILSLPKKIKKFNENGKWVINWYRLLGIGIPILIISLTPILYYSIPVLGDLYVDLNLLLVVTNPMITRISGIIFGYNLVSSITKETKVITEVSHPIK